MIGRADQLFKLWLTAVADDPDRYNTNILYWFVVLGDVSWNFTPIWGKYTINIKMSMDWFNYAF